MFEDVLNVNSEYSEDFLKHNILKNISGFKLKSFDDKDVTILNKTNDLPTILVFGSPTCGACTDCWEYLSKLDTKSFNFMYVVTSINADELNETKQNTIKILKDRGIKISTNDIFFDAVDFIWRKILQFTTTPQIVMLNEFNEITNFMTNDSSNFTSLSDFMEHINKILEKTYHKTLKQKQEIINITLVNGNDRQTYSINKGEKLNNIVNPSKSMHRFKGWKLEDQFIDLNTYIFTNDSVLVAEFEKIAVLTDDLKNINHQLIDLRNANAFNKNHLNGAINLPFVDYKNQFLSLNIDKSKTIILYGANEFLDLIDFTKSNGYETYYLYDYKEDESKERTYQQRKENGEFDSYILNREKESQNLLNHYAQNYLDLEFKDFDKQIIKIKDKLQKPNQPTIIMIGSTTCGSCKTPWNEFLAMSETFEYNFLESVIFGSTNEDATIDYELSKLDKSEIDAHKKYRMFDINRYYGLKDHPLYTSETPVFYILDKEGNLTNLVSSFYKAIECVENLNDTISVRDIKGEETINGVTYKRFESRKANGEFSHIESNEKLFDMLSSSYAKFVLKQKYYDYTHAVKSISNFFSLNQYSFSNPTVLYIMNSKNSDFEESINFLDSMSINNNDKFNFLTIVDNESSKHNELINKPYKTKIMFDDSNTNVSTDYVLSESSYFLVLDVNGNVCNVFTDYSDLNKILNLTYNTASVLSPNKLTKHSVIKPGDETISKVEAFNNGWISHIDSTKDSARYEYLDRNFGRNYHDFEVINNQGLNVKISTLVDGKRPTIVCFLQDYQDDYYYNFLPLLEVKDKANIMIVFTNTKNTPYNQEYVDYMIKQGEEKSIEKAKSPYNYPNFEKIVKEQNPTLEGEELKNAVYKYIESVYDYDPIKPYIYGSTTAITTPLLETNIRGIQLYLDRNGNLTNISQTYYVVGSTFKSVVDKIGNKIAIEI